MEMNAYLFIEWLLVKWVFGSLTHRAPPQRHSCTAAQLTCSSVCDCLKWEITAACVTEFIS